MREGDDTVMTLKDGVIDVLLALLYRSDTEHFGLAPPEFPLVQELEADISMHEKMWSFHVEYTEDLNQLSKEDWISFRYVCAPIVEKDRIRNFHFLMMRDKNDEIKMKVLININK